MNFMLPVTLLTCSISRPQPWDWANVHLGCLAEGQEIDCSCTPGVDGSGESQGWSCPSVLGDASEYPPVVPSPGMSRALEFSPTAPTNHHPHPSLQLLLPKA